MENAENQSLQSRISKPGNCISNAGAAVTGALEDSMMKRNSLRSSGERKPIPKCKSLKNCENKHLTLLRLGETSNPQDVYDFDLEVFEVMKNKESDMLPNPNYFSIQHTITPRIRCSIVDWIVKVHGKLGMHTDTLFTAVELMDRYLSDVTFDRSKLQILSCTALLVAAKNEEVYSPSTNDFIYICKNSFTASDMNQMERDLIFSLDCRIGPIHSSHFLKRFVRFTEPCSKLTMLAYFINEMSLLDENFIGMVPSLRAAAVVALAQHLVQGPGKWTQTMVDNTGYELADLQETAKMLLAAVGRFNHSRYGGITHKYSVKALKNVSAYDFPPLVNLE